MRSYLWVLCILLGLQCMASGAVWTASPWNDDASSGVVSGGTYTHAINFSDPEAPTVNGIAFTATASNVGADWAYSGGMWFFNANDTTNITGNSADLGRDFQVSGRSTHLQLTGLDPNLLYEVTLFSVAWETDGSPRAIRLTHEGGYFWFDQNAYGTDNGVKVTGIYRPDASGNFDVDVNGDYYGGDERGLHFYAFANRVYPGDVPVAAVPASPAQQLSGIRVPIDTVLSWVEGVPGNGGATPVYDVYIDPNETKVIALDASAKVSSKQSGLSFDPDLDPNKVYYWSIATYIDVADTEPNNVTDIHRFRTVYDPEPWSDVSWTNDSDSGISAGKVYTHKVNYNASEGVSTVINGVSFENDSDRTGSNWSLAGAPFGAGGGHNVGGDGGAIVSSMYYNTPAELTLTGLTPGTEYVLVQYTRGWGGAGARNVLMTVNLEDGHTTRYDGNVDGDGNGHLFKYTYTAPASGQLTLTYDALRNADSWHHYGFSNEVVTAIYLDPTPLPGASINSDVELSWVLNGAVVNPTYNLKVATDAGMTSLVVSETGLSATTYTVFLNNDTQYYWQVEVVEDGSPVVYTSPVWDFITTPPQDATMVMEWKFDETLGVVAAQTGPTADADGVLVGYNDPNAPGTCHVAGLVNNGLLLNGKDEYVDVSDAEPYMPTADGQPFAVSGYFRTFDNYGPLFSMRNAADGNPIIDIALGADGVQTEPGKVCLLVRDDNGSVSWTNSGITVNDGRWHNFIVTRAAGKWTLYIDGVSVATINGAATGNVDLDLLAIGTSLRWIMDDWQPENSHLRDFEGILDEYTVWDGELQPGQIATLASIVPPQGDIDFDLDTDVDDLGDLSGAWLTDDWTPVQANALLEDMETYTSDPNSYKDNWTHTPTEGFADLTLSVIPDPNGLYGKVMQMDYVFDNDAGELHGWAWVTLLNPGANLSLYDQVDIRIKKLPGCDISQIILDFYDGRDKVDPSNDDLYNKGRIGVGISEVPDGVWTVVTATIPADHANLQTCTDLYRILFSIEDGGEDAGTLLIDSIELTDATEDCVPVVGQTVPDFNGDCDVDLLDYAEQAEGWLNGI